MRIYQVAMYFFPKCFQLFDEIGIIIYIKKNNSEGRGMGTHRSFLTHISIYRRGATPGQHYQRRAHDLSILGFAFY